MTTIDELEQLVDDYEHRISELKMLEKDFNKIDTFGYEKEAASIKKMLKDPKALNQVKSEINQLKRKIQDKIKTQISSDQELETRLKTLLAKNNDIKVEDIQNQIEKNNTDEAKKLLEKREKNFDEYLKMGEEINKVESKIRLLADRVADGDLDSDAYKRAHNDLTTTKKSLEEKLWKLRNKLFKDDYEKPF